MLDTILHISLGGRLSARVHYLARRHKRGHDERRVALAAGSLFWAFLATTDRRLALAALRHQFGPRALHDLARLTAVPSRAGGTP